MSANKKRKPTGNASVIEEKKPETSEEKNKDIVLRVLTNENLDELEKIQDIIGEIEYKIIFI